MVYQRPHERYISNTAWKVSKYDIFPGPYFPFSVRILENTDQKNSAVGHFLPCVINRNLEILLRQNSQFCKPRINTVFHGTESISNVGPKIWKLLPSILDRYVTWMNFKRSLNNGDLRIVLVDCAKILFKMSALCKI